MEKNKDKTTLQYDEAAKEALELACNIFEAKYRKTDLNWLFKILGVSSSGTAPQEETKDKEEASFDLTTSGQEPVGLTRSNPPKVSQDQPASFGTISASPAKDEHNFIFLYS